MLFCKFWIFFWNCVECWILLMLWRIAGELGERLDLVGRKLLVFVKLGEGGVLFFVLLLWKSFEWICCEFWCGVWLVVFVWFRRGDSDLMFIGWSFGNVCILSFFCRVFFKLLSFCFCFLRVLFLLVIWFCRLVICCFKFVIWLLWSECCFWSFWYFLSFVICLLILFCDWFIFVCNCFIILFFLLILFCSFWICDFKFFLIVISFCESLVLRKYRLFFFI